MAKSFDELVARTVSKADQARAKARAGVLRREMLLAEIRKASGYSQAALARKLGTSQPGLSKIESGRPEVTTLKRIVEAIGGELIVGVKFPKKRMVRIRDYDERSWPATKVGATGRKVVAKVAV
jgi:DNA-binding XRE family transcriptional regulator